MAQKMSKKKTVSAVVAGVLAATVAIGGAYAWLDYEQSARNTLEVDAAPEVLLHDDFDGVNDNYDGENKDVYVENTGTAAVFVRVKFAEYLQIGSDSLLPAFTEDGSATVEKARLEEEGETWPVTWPVHRYDEAAPGVCNLVSHDYFTWNISGEETEYLSTVKNLTVLTDEERAAFEAAAEGDEVTIRASLLDETAASDATTTVIKKKTEATVEAMPLSVWAADPEAYTTTACWLLDTDGWAYWSQPLAGGTATNKLLDEVVTDKLKFYDNSIYHIDVQLQAATFNDLEKWMEDGIKAVANPDNDVATVTANGEIYIRYMTGNTTDYMYEEYVEGTNVYTVYSRNMFETEWTPTGTYAHAGNDGVIGNADDNMLAGRSLANSGGVAISSIDVTGADVTEWKYYLKNAETDYYVTAGMDKKLGTYDDVIRTDTGKLGEYDYMVEGTDQSIGWNYLYGPLDNMLVATEYVFANTMFNATLDDNGYKYINSGVHADMKEYWTEFGMDVNIVNALGADNPLDMSTDSAIGINAYICPDPTHSHGTNGATCSSASTYKFADYYTLTAAQADINLTEQNTRFFALSLQEIDKAYGACEQVTEGELPEIQRLRAARTGERWASSNNATGTLHKYNNFTGYSDVYTSHYWLRSPGYVGSRAAIVLASGDLSASSTVTNTYIGVRPACYLNLKSELS